MNFLAHSLLSGKDPDIITGNIITDLIRKKDETAYKSDIRIGIDLHRFIDSYTDNHELVVDTLKKLYPHHGKYSSVLLDIFWDYFLVKNWKNYSNEDLEHYTMQMYAILKSNMYFMQEKVSTKLTIMIDNDFLSASNDKFRLNKSFEYLQKRLKFSEQANFGMAVQTLDIYEEALNEQFVKFFDDMSSAVALKLKKLST